MVSRTSVRKAKEMKMEKKMSVDQFVEFSAAVLRSLPREMDVDVAQGWIENQAALANVLREALVPPAVDWHREWQKFYQEVFGLATDLSGVTIPSEKPGFGWVVMIADGLVLNRVWAKCKEKFPSYSYFGDDLDKAVPKNVRTAETAYAKRFRDRVEADGELKDLSASQLAEKSVQSITLLERLLLELWYFWKTGKHLDIQNITLCAGSRGSGGSVPGVCWGSGKLEVGYCSPDGRSDGLRTRAAV